MTNWRFYKDNKENVQGTNWYSNIGGFLVLFALIKFFIFSDTWKDTWKDIFKYQNQPFPTNKFTPDANKNPYNFRPKLNLQSNSNYSDSLSKLNLQSNSNYSDSLFNSFDKNNQKHINKFKFDKNLLIPPSTFNGLLVPPNKSHLVSPSKPINTLPSIKPNISMISAPKNPPVIPVNNIMKLENSPGLNSDKNLFMPKLIE